MTINYNALFIGFGVVIAFLFLLAAIGMSAPRRHTSGRPPMHPPGQKRRR